MGEPYFRTQRPEDPLSTFSQGIRDIYWNAFGHFATPGASVDIDDFDVTVVAMREATGWTKSSVEQAIFSHARLQHLPKLRALQAKTRVMDLQHLRAIDTVLAELGPEITDEAYAEFDAMLTETFTPKRAGQNTPQTTTITRRIREMIKRIDPTCAYQPTRRQQRVAQAHAADDAVTFEASAQSGTVKTLVTLATNPLTAQVVRNHVLATAREHKTSMADAMVKLLSGEITPTKTTLHVFVPKDREVGGPAYVPGVGALTPEATAALEDLLASAKVTEVDMEAELQAHTDSYTPTEAMRRVVCARHTHCVFPGCTVPSLRCQLDHRIPFGQGGKTTPSNLYPLCQKHHNLKTDKRGFYVPDPDTGEILWLFSNGTYELTAPDSLIAHNTNAAAPRWKSNLEQVCQRRSVVAQFYAKGHKILDDFDNHHNLDLADAQIAALEEEYGLVFPIKAVLPEPLPKEPDFCEPPFPDPEDAYAWSEDYDPEELVDTRPE
ncbi:HNH endonuclease signature motif containing protein [Corynebacterium riegelii]